MTSRTEAEGQMSVALVLISETARFHEERATDPLIREAFAHLDDLAKRGLKIYAARHRAALASASVPMDTASDGRQAEEEVEAEEARDEETYQIGKRDGYEKAVQDIDELTGGDGEYRVSPDPGRHCPGPEAMKANIVARFEALAAASLPGEVERLRAMEDAPKDGITRILACNADGDYFVVWWRGLNRKPHEDPADWYISGTYCVAKNLVGWISLSEAADRQRARDGQCGGGA